MVMSGVFTKEEFEKYGFRKKGYKYYGMNIFYNDVEVCLVKEVFDGIFEVVKYYNKESGQRVSYM
jgi:hypothetical protein